MRNREQEMVRLRFEKGMLLDDIGELYGVSGERVRQIVGNTGRMASKVRAEKIRNEGPEITSPELAEKYNLSLNRISSIRDSWHKIDGDNPAAVGNKWEGRVADMLESMGHDVELQSIGSPFDILLDGRIRIDVKSSSRYDIPPSQKGKLINPFLKFNIRKYEGREPVDFYILVAIETKDIFVVPYRKIGMGVQFIQFNWPTARPEIGKYQKYLDRFDLLRAG